MSVVIIAALPGGVAAQRGRAELNDGNRLYAEGRFGEAHEKYLEALRDAPDLPLALFNDGNAFRNLSTTMGHSWGLIRERFPVWRGMGWED